MRDKRSIVVAIVLLLVTLAALRAPSHVSVTVQAQSEAQVVFSSPEVAFIVGPQVKSGTSQMSGAQWFDQNAIDRGLSLCAAFPDVAHTPGNVLISGTVAVTKGSKVVTGSGTKFLSEARDYAIIQNGPSGRIVKIISSVQSDTQLTLTVEWQGETLTSQSVSSPTATEIDNYQGYLNYYDFGQIAYINYYRTGDQRFLDCARKVTDSWWSQPIVDYGKNLISVSGDSLAPRSISLNGLMLRALDGRPEMWPWITDYARYQFNGWVEVPTGWAEKDPTTAPLYFGVRDGGLMLLYAANLAAVHPDAAIRAEFKPKVLRSAVNYYAALQKPDGSYRWNVDGDGGFQGSEQPFMIGLLNEGMIAAHQLTGDDRVKAAILKSVEHERQFSYNPTYRAMYYYIHGVSNHCGVPKAGSTTGETCWLLADTPIHLAGSSTFQHAFKAFSFEKGGGNAAGQFPPTDPNLVIEARQLNATAISQFGYAYVISGDPEFKTWGDEIFDATYSGRDGYRGLANARGKEYNEAYRSGGRYLAWRVAGSAPLPSPTATPSATPTVAPTPLPSPTVTPKPSPSATPTPSPSPNKKPCKMWPPNKWFSCL